MMSQTKSRKKSGPDLVFHDEADGLWFYRGNCIELLDSVAAKYPEGHFDAIFAEPPYSLSNAVSSRLPRDSKLNHEFNLDWLRRCRRALKPNGTIWVWGAHQVIYSIGYAMQKLGFKILNSVVWQRPNPPQEQREPSIETIIWAAKNEKSKHLFNYQEMRKVTGKQMKTVWRAKEFPISEEEKPLMWASATYGHRRKNRGYQVTQKPVSLIERCIAASTNEGHLVFSPFLGNGSTAIAAKKLKRKFIGVESNEALLKIAVKRIKTRRLSGSKSKR